MNNLGLNFSILVSKKTLTGVFVLILFFFTSCMQVKPYQKVYLNDKDMQLRREKVEAFESSFQSYREGSSGAESGKTGGGCGCN